MARKKYQQTIPSYMMTQQTATLPSTPMERFWRKVKHIKYAKISTILVYILMIGLIIFEFIPVMYMLTTAFKPINELLIYPPTFYVQSPTLSNFTNLTKAISTTEVPFSRYIFNSVLTTVATVTLTVIICSMGSYALSKFKLKGANFIFSVLVAALSFGGASTAIPTYLITNSLHMNDTYWVLIIPKIVSAYYLFLIKQFCDQIPDDFIEAAYLDGAGEWTIFWKIIMPCLKPVMASVIVFAFVGNWNDYSNALIYITDQSMKTLPLALQLISQTGTLSRMGAMEAASLLTTLPTFIIYIIMQNKVLEGVGYSGVKS